MLLGLMAIGLFAASVAVLVLVRQSRRAPPETDYEEQERVQRRLREWF